MGDFRIFFKVGRDKRGHILSRGANCTISQLYFLNQESQGRGNYVGQSAFNSGPEHIPGQITEKSLGTQAKSFYVFRGTSHFPIECTGSIS